MRLNGSVRGSSGYVVTEKGRYDLVHLETCKCRVRIVGLLVLCEACGTVYGHMSEQLSGNPMHVARID